MYLVTFYNWLPFTNKAEAGASSFFCLGCLLLWRDSVYCLTLWSTPSRTRAVTSYKQCADISVEQHVVLLKQHSFQWWAWANNSTVEVSSKKPVRQLHEWLGGEMWTILQQWKPLKGIDRGPKVISDSTPLLSFEKTPSKREAIYSFIHVFTPTPFFLCLYLDVVRSKPAGVLMAAQGQNVKIHQHSKVPTL